MARLLSYGANPSLIAAFNGDGNLDYADIGSTAVYGLAGNGNDTFAAAKSVAVSPVSASGFGTTGDFYNIGIPAVAVTTGLSPSYVEIVPLLKLPTTVGVTCAPSAGSFGNSATTCTAQTTAGATGLMSITYNGTAWGSGDVNASGAFSVSGLGGMPAGSYTIAATYAGDAKFNGSSGSVTYYIDHSVPLITWANPAPITFGTPLSATQLDATASVPGTFVYTPAAGTVLGVGSQTLSVTFTPTDTVDYTTVTDTVSLTVNKGATVTQISSSPNPSTYGSSVAFSVLVNGNGATPSATGSVSFFDGATNLGSASVTSTASTTNLAPYSQQLTGSTWGGYCGPTSNMTPNAGAAPDGTITATKFVMPSSFTCGSGVSFGALDSIVGGLQAGQIYTASVWLRGANGGESVGFGLDDGYMSWVTLTTSWQRYSYTFPAYVTDGEQARGFQVFSDSPNATYYVWGAQTVASPSMGAYVATYGANSASGAGAAATFSTTSLPAGAQAITAVYNGDANWLGSTSAVLTQSVTPAVLTVTANNASKVYGTANPAFTPTYSGFVNGDTSAVLTGSPSLTTTATAASPVGSYTITAAAGTLSAANYSFTFVNGTLTITKATSVLSVTSSLNPSVYGNSVTFTLTVGGSGSGVVPTGTVTFTEGGTTLLPTTALNGSGQATYITSTLPVGANTLTLTYSGDTNYF